MNENSSWDRRHGRGPHDALISAISLGAVFILIGLVFVLALPDNLWDKTIGFFNNFAARQVPGINITLPAPANPGAHTVFYTALFQFSLGITILEILTLALRIGFSSRTRRIAETVGNLVFWSGASYLEYTHLNHSTTPSTWFTFWALLIVVIGFSIIARGAVRLARR
jgi:hypothetical protein